jgi:hypothetical protein
VSGRIAIISLFGLAAMTAPVQAAAPPNDNLADAQEITDASGAASGTTIDATLEPGENSSFTARDPYFLRAKDVWYLWTAPASGPVAFRTINPDPVNYRYADTGLAAETGGDITTFDEIAYNDDYPFSQWMSRIVFNASAGTTYEIGVGNYPRDGSQAPFGLEWGATDYYDVDNPRVTASATTTKKSLTVTFSVSDETGNVVPGWVSTECRLNDQAYEPCTSPWTKALPGSTNTWSVRATDGAGNVGTANSPTRSKGPRR